MNYRDLFIEPLDVLSPRGNQPFGDPGEHAAAQLQPWPSVLCGALRSAALAQQGYSTGRNIANLVAENAELAQQLALPGATNHAAPFQLGCFGLAHKDGDNVEPIVPVPDDVAITGEVDAPIVTRVEPAPMPAGIKTSSRLSRLPVLKTGANSKPLRGFWLTAKGWRSYCAGKALSGADLVSTAQIASRRSSVGIGMDPHLRTVEKGQLYTAERIEFHTGMGYWARVYNPQDCHTHPTLLRLGGDGHGARLHEAQVDWPSVPVEAINSSKRFAVVLCSPCLFENANTPAGIGSDGLWQTGSFSAQLIARTAGRVTTISGWDLQKNRPKTARRFVPAGAVYWFDQLSGCATDVLATLANGAWDDPLASAEHRLTEGFNQIQLLAWYGDK